MAAKKKRGRARKAAVRRHGRRAKAQARRLPAFPEVKAERFALDYPKEEPFRAESIAPPEERMGRIELPAPQMAQAGVKKQIPRAATAIVAAAALTAVLAALFTFALGADLVLAAGVSLPLLVGFSILFFNALEARG